MKRYFYTLLLLVLVCCLGCTGRIPAHGVVKFSDGTPLESGTIFMSNGLVMFQGGLQENGRFSIGEWKDGDGIPPGQYRVWIANANKIENVYDKTGEKVVKRIDITVIDRKYESPDTSGLTFEVKPGQKNEIEIIIEKP